MNDEHKIICLALYEATRLPGSRNKRMAKGLRWKAAADEELTEKQTEWMFRLLYRYRAQLPDLYQKHINNPFYTRLKRQP